MEVHAATKPENNSHRSVERMHTSSQTTEDGWRTTSGPTLTEAPGPAATQMPQFSLLPWLSQWQPPQPPNSPLTSLLPVVPWSLCSRPNTAGGTRPSDSSCFSARAKNGTISATAARWNCLGAGCRLMTSRSFGDVCCRMIIDYIVDVHIVAVVQLCQEEHRSLPKTPVRVSSVQFQLPTGVATANAKKHNARSREEGQRGHVQMLELVAELAYTGCSNADTRSIRTMSWSAATPRYIGRVPVPYHRGRCCLPAVTVAGQQEVLDGASRMEYWTMRLADESRVVKTVNAWTRSNWGLLMRGRLRGL